MRYIVHINVHEVYNPSYIIMLYGNIYECACTYVCSVSVVEKNAIKKKEGGGGGNLEEAVVTVMMIAE